VPSILLFDFDFDFDFGLVFKNQSQSQSQKSGLNDPKRNVKVFQNRTIYCHITHPNPSERPKNGYSALGTQFAIVKGKNFGASKNLKP
jgi:hypothetical protein